MRAWALVLCGVVACSSQWTSTLTIARSEHVITNTVDGAATTAPGSCPAVLAPNTVCAEREARYDATRPSSCSEVAVAPSEHVVSCSDRETKSVQTWVWVVVVPIALVGFLVGLAVITKAPLGGKH